MKKQEQQFWADIKDEMPGRWLRVESPITPGIPDLLGLVGGRTILIELKAHPTWSRKKTNLQVSPKQRLFLWQWKENGGTAYVLSRVEGDVFLLDPLLMDRDYTRTRAILKDVAVAWGFEPVKNYIASGCI